MPVTDIYKSFIRILVSKMGMCYDKSSKEDNPVSHSGRRG